MEEGGGLISVRVRFTTSADVANVECALLELRQAQNCKQTSQMMFCELHMSMCYHTFQAIQENLPSVGYQLTDVNHSSWRLLPLIK